MPVLDIEPGQNPNAPGVMTFGSQGQNPGFLVDTAGNLTLLGALVVVSQTVDTLNLRGAAASTKVLDARVTGDAQPRFAVLADGGHQWGPGNTATDTNLYRSGVGALTTDGSLSTGGQIAAFDAVNVRRTNSFDNAFTARDTDDPFLRYQVSCEGNTQWGDGAGAPDTNLYRLSANNLATDDNLILATAGRSLRIKEGANACMGRATLVGGTVTVNTTAVSANSEVFLTCQTPGGTPGFLRVSARVAGTSFTILSSSGTDTSVVAWMIVEPSP